MGIISVKSPNITDHIRKNGTGKLYANTVGASGPGVYLGHFGPGFSKAITPSVEKETDYSEAARGDIMEVITSVTNELTIPLREWQQGVVQMAFFGSSFTANNQVASSLDGVSTAFTVNNFVDLGKRNVYSTKVLHGADAVSHYAINETVTATSGGTGKIKWKVNDSYVELINVTGTIAVGDTITGGTSGTTSVVSAVQTNNDVIVCDAEPGTVRYVNGTHYTLNYEWGFFRVDSTIVSPCFVSAQYGARDISYMFSNSTTSVQKKLTFTSNDGDVGPRFMVEFWKVNLTLNGDVMIVGDGISLFNFKGTVLQDDTQPTGQKYEKWTFKS